MSNARIITRLSGGRLNTKPLDSIGGPASASLGGVVTSASAVFAGGTFISGVYVIGSHGGIPGIGTLRWDNTKQTLRWTDAAANQVEIDCTSSGFYSLGYGAYQDVLVYVNYGLLPAAIVDFQIYTASSRQTILRNVELSERSAGLTIYRAMFLQNVSLRPLESVTAQFTSSPANGTIQVGSEYLTDTQDSDGLLTDLPTQLADETDSGSDLPAISWASTWNCGTILPGKYVSYWLRYNLPAGSSGTSLVTETYEISVTYTRSS